MTIWCNRMSTSMWDEQILARADEIWDRTNGVLPEGYVYTGDEDEEYATATTPNASYEGDPEAVYAMMFINYDQTTNGVEGSSPPPKHGWRRTW